MMKVQKKLSKNIPLLKIKLGSGLIKFSPSDDLLDEELVGKAVMACLKDNDPEGVIDILNAHYRAQSRLVVADSGLSNSTFYHVLKSKNPTLKTLAKLMSSLK